MIKEVTMRVFDREKIKPSYLITVRKTTEFFQSTSELKKLKPNVTLYSGVVKSITDKELVIDRSPQPIKFDIDLFFAPSEEKMTNRESYTHYEIIGAVEHLSLSPEDKELKRNISRVYDELTGISNPFASPDLILKEVYKRMVNKEIAYDDLRQYITEKGEVDLTLDDLRTYFNSEGDNHE